MTVNERVSSHQLRHVRLLWLIAVTVASFTAPVLLVGADHLLVGVLIIPPLFYGLARLIIEELALRRPGAFRPEWLRENRW